MLEVEQAAARKLERKSCIFFTLGHMRIKSSSQSPFVFREESASCSYHVVDV